MKKLIIYLTMVLMIVSVQPVFAKDTEIEGLHENWSKLFMTNCFTEEEIAAMDEEYMTAWKEKLLNEIIPSRVALGRLETDTTETEYEYELEQAKLDYNKGIRISLLTTYKYAEQYASCNVFPYLFSDNEFWAVPLGLYSDRAKFTINGRYLNSSSDMNNEFGIYYSGFNINESIISFIKKEENIKNLITNIGASSLDELKIFYISSEMTFLYARCDNKDYLMKMYAHTGSTELLKEMDPYKLYDINEVIDIIIEDHVRTVSSTKPTYQTEAEALQAEGLLYGNENGLDLLKPLSRIETAAMLLRALGESEDADTSSTQVFTDVAPTHWGYGAAQNAYSLGLIYGVGDSLFAPDRKVTATEFSSMVLRAMGENDFDWQSATDILIERGILTAEQAETMDLFTRGDMAKIIYEVRNRGLLG